MKKIASLFALSGLLLSLSSCDKNFEEINRNPVAATTTDPVYLFSNAQLSTTFTQDVSVKYEYAIVQQFVTPFGGVLAGGNFNQNNVNMTPATWNQLYNTPVKFLVDVVNSTKADPLRANLYQMARIWKAYTFMVLTDTYGDIPYKEAGQAYLTGATLPKYDPQQEIYTDLINEVDQATTALDATKRIETGDLVYKGDIAKWKRFGNSLLLRMGMRLTKVDPARAQTIVQKAVAGGVMQSNADNAYILRSSTFQSPIGSYWSGTEKANFYLAQPFVDYLKTTSDPRLKSIAVKYTDPTKNPSETTENNKPEDQIGMPIGYDDATIATAPNFQGKVGAGYKYSQINRRTIGKIDTPEFYVTHAQTQLLLAEAAQRGWVTAGSAAAYYTAGVTAHMQQLAQYDAGAAVAQADIDAYLKANPFNPANALEQINTQYWVASFLNGPELFANFRRSGFPRLTANPYKATNLKKETFIRRITYPINELSVNEVNYQAAATRMGADDLDTRVWWDKQ